MQQDPHHNYAFIDAQNLYLNVKTLGWKVDYIKFRRYLKEKYRIERAYMFMGFLPGNQDLYNFLQTTGFILVFKPTIPNQDGDVKGNCDAELVLQVMIDFLKYEKALLVTGDGDFYCLVKYLQTKGKLLRVLDPSPQSCSSLLTKIARNDITFVSDLKHKVAYIRKEPHADETA